VLGMLLPLVAETLFFEKRGSFLAQQRYKKPYGKGQRQGMGYRGIHLLQTRPAKAKKFPLVPNKGYGKGPHKT
jgi:hypothetical protein